MSARYGMSVDVIAHRCCSLMRTPALATRRRAISEFKRPPRGVSLSSFPLTAPLTAPSQIERGSVVAPGRDRRAGYADHDGLADRAVAVPHAVFPTWRTIIWTVHRGQGQHAWEAWLHDERIWGSGRTEAEALGNLLRWHDQEVMQALATQLGAAAPTEICSSANGQLSASDVAEAGQRLTSPAAATVSHAIATGSSRNLSVSQPVMPASPAGASGQLCGMQRGDPGAIGEESPA